jgi:hypothetical protein
MPRLRRSVAVLCVLVIIAAALLAPAAGGARFAGILVPLAPLFGFVVLGAFRADDLPLTRSVLGSSRLPSRAPPCQV